MSLFKKAERKRVFLKVGLMGASGAGKTRSALELAKGLADGGRIAVIDTENGSASLYSHVTEFLTLDMEPPFDPAKYIEGIKAAEEEGFKVIVIDSFTHAWKYLLAKKEGLDARGGRQNQYTNWGPVKAEADRLKDVILQSRIHVIACMRSKTEYAQEGGKVTKVGLAAVQEPDVEYEFTTVFQIDAAHNAQQTKDRTGLFGDRIFRIDPGTGKTFLNWLDEADSQEIATPPIMRNTDWYRSLNRTDEHANRLSAVARRVQIVPEQLLQTARDAGLTDPEDVIQSIETLHEGPVE